MNSRDEILKKLKQQRIPDFLEIAFEQQKKFILDKSTYKALLCARRSGKSYALGICLLLTAFKHPGSKSLFVSMSNESCQNILYKDILEPLIKIFNLQGKVKLIRGDKPRVEFANGSRISLFGTDSAEDKKDDLLGQKFMLVVIDEAQDISVNLEDLIVRVLSWTITDYLKEGSQMIMAGTPSNFTDSYFFRITKDYQDAEGWAFHRWSQMDNPHMREALKQKLAADKKANPNIETTTYHKQMALGEWVINSSALVYRPRYYNENGITKCSNFIDAIPDNLLARNDWQYGLGVDFGFTDSDAFFVVGWLHDSKKLYVIEGIAKTGNDDFSTAHTIQRLGQKYDLSWIVVDGSSKKTMETLKQRFGLPLEAADKIQKFDCISVFNNDLESGCIQILPQPQSLLVQEWNKLIWDPKSPRREKEGLPNHCSDALLYAWRKATNWASVEPVADNMTEFERYQRWLEWQKPKTLMESLDDKYSLTWSDDDFN